MSFKFVKKNGAKDPTVAPGNAAGIDFYPCVDGVIKAGEISHKIHTGIEPEQMPDNTYLHLMIRSGRALKNKLALNAGVIDRDYTGEIILIINNFGTQDYNYSSNEAIAQGIFIHYYDPNRIKLESVSEHTIKTERGSNGFGSTDKNIVSVVGVINNDEYKTNAILANEDLGEKAIKQIVYDMDQHIDLICVAK